MLPMGMVNALRFTSALLQSEHATGVISPTPAVPNGYSGAMSEQTRRPVLPWALWDAGAASFNAVMTTFVFTVYLTGSDFGDETRTSLVLSAGLVCAGLVIALTAPVIGQRADRAGSRRSALALNTGGIVVCSAACFLVAPEPGYLFLGVGLLSLGNVFSEIATVHYNALLPSISTPRTLGRISGLGWSMGYFGGILALLIVLLGFITPGVLGIPEDDALNIRAVALFAALWTALLSAPLLLRFPRGPAEAPEAARRDSLAESYRRLWRTLRRLFREEPATLRFFLASAVFRDGLAGVFTYGGVLAAGSFGFSFQQVLVFAIAGNVVAGLGAVLGGRLDDALGPRTVILASLTGLLVAAAPLLVLRDPLAFWVCGLALCAFVGPAQSAARTYLVRIAEPGSEGEYFGLYSTTGRAVSFLAPAMFALTVWIFGAQIWGVLGIMAVLLAGLLLTLRLPRLGADRADRA
ncbi:MFS transporter [Rothia halotolerans]|uniref:MFS transporter n=1 Tax=Rothia halotolerans TaxID=405770 RepID=UPI0023536D42|nr:MFS transporter [Rothia halotolerans]